MTKSTDFGILSGSRIDCGKADKKVASAQGFLIQSNDGCYLNSDLKWDSYDGVKGAHIHPSNHIGFISGLAAKMDPKPVIIRPAYYSDEGETMLAKGKEIPFPDFKGDPWSWERFQKAVKNGLRFFQMRQNERRKIHVWNHDHILDFYVIAQRAVEVQEIYRDISHGYEGLFYEAAFARWEGLLKERPGMRLMTLERERCGICHQSDALYCPAYTSGLGKAEYGTYRILLTT